MEKLEEHPSILPIFYQQPVTSLAALYSRLHNCGMFCLLFVVLTIAYIGILAALLYALWRSYNRMEPDSLPGPGMVAMKRGVAAATVLSVLFVFVLITASLLFFGLIKI